MDLAAVDPTPPLGAAIDAALTRAAQLARPVLLSVSRPLSGAEDALPLIAAAHAAGVATAFMERRAGDCVAAFGAAWSCEAAGPQRIEALGSAARVVFEVAHRDGDLPPLAVAAFGFVDAIGDDDVWRGFPSARVAIPRVAIVRRDGQAALQMQTMVEPGSAATAIAQRLTHTIERLRRWRRAPIVAADDEIGARYDTVSVPAPAAWQRAVIATTDDIAAGRFVKLVLARSCHLRATREFDCARAVTRLRDAYPSCTTFWFGSATGNFLGATPELLVRLRGGMLAAAALAGTAARGTSTAADDELACALLASDKDRREHAVVRDALVAALTPLCSDLQVAATPQVLRLPNVQHLLTPIRGRLRAALHLVDVVARLHPTPAVGGAPRAAALAALPEREALARGWYAGPIGWFDAAGDGDIEIAIRSALVRERHAVLFAGVGIVAGSDPDAELTETRLKLQPLLSALLEL